MTYGGGTALKVLQWKVRYLSMVHLHLWERSRDHLCSRYGLLFCPWSIEERGLTDEALQNRSTLSSWV